MSLILDKIQILTQYPNRWIERFLLMKPAWRFSLIIAVTVWIAFRTYLIIKHDFLSRLHDIIHLPMINKAGFLADFDSVVFITGISTLLFIATLFPKSDNNKSQSLKHPLLISSLLLIGLFAFFLAVMVFAPLIPYLFCKGNELLSIEDNKYLFPGSPYFGQAIQLAVFLALFFTDALTRSVMTRILTALSVIVFFPYSTLTPLLWWSAASGWLPSKFWGFTKPLLSALTFGLFMMSVPLSAPIFNNHYLPYCCHSKVFTFPDCRSYHAQPSPDETDIYLGCDSRVTRFAKREKGWKELDHFARLYEWDEAAYDFANRRIFVFSGETGILHQFDMDDPSINKQYQIPLKDYPVRSELIYHGYDPTTNLLVLTDHQGLTATFDANTYERKNAILITSRSMGVRRMLIDSRTSEMIVLQSGRLSRFRLEDLSLIRSVLLDQDAFGMAIDQAGDRIFVSIPQSAKVQVFSKSTLKLLQEIPGPLAVRAVGYDPDSMELFTGAITGAVEIYDGQTLNRKQRLRIAPWIRRFAILPKSGKAVVTFGYDHNTVLWDYRNQNKNTKDRLLEASEKMILKVQTYFPNIIPTAIPDDRDSSNSGFLTKLFTRKAERILLVESDPFQREMGRSVLDFGGYQTLSVENAKQAQQVIIESEKPFTLILVDLKNEPELRKMHTLFPKTRVITTYTQDEPRKDNAVPKPFSYFQLLQFLKNIFED